MKEEKVEETEKEFEIISTFPGSELENKEYVPLFDYYFDKMHPKGCFRILCGNHVVSETGTGIVHTAPAFGDEDYKICVRYGVIDPADPCVSIDESGLFLPIVKDFAGKLIKETDKEIIKFLQDKGRVVKSGMEVHSYPFCWRSNTPLIYKAVNTWFIKVSSIRERLLANNK